MLDKKIGRRSLLKGAIASLVAIPVVGIGTAEAAAAVDVNDPQAKGLGFVLDASTANPKAPAGQMCSTCAVYSGNAQSGPCAVFAGKVVPAKGYCHAWVKKG
jgi:hypothetical protein